MYILSKSTTKRFILSLILLWFQNLAFGQYTALYIANKTPYSLKISALNKTQVERAASFSKWLNVLDQTSFQFDLFKSKREHSLNYTLVKNNQKEQFIEIVMQNGVPKILTKSSSENTIYTMCILEKKKPEVPFVKLSEKETAKPCHMDSATYRKLHNGLKVLKNDTAKNLFVTQSFTKYCIEIKQLDSVFKHFKSEKMKLNLLDSYYHMIIGINRLPELSNHFKSEIGLANYELWIEEKKKK